MLLLRPEILSGAVLFRAMVPLMPEKQPNLSGRPVFLAAGRPIRSSYPKTQSACRLLHGSRSGRFTEME
jgi:predicted esterase